MDLIRFPEVNRVYAENQPEYRPLPCMALEGVDGRIVFCWKLTWRERLRVLFRGELWHTVLTFNKQLQPQLLEAECPILRVNERLYFRGALAEFIGRWR